MLAEILRNTKGPLYSPLLEGKTYDPFRSLKDEFQLKFSRAWPKVDIASVNSIFQGIKN